MYLVFDEETETWHSKKRKSNPFDTRNWVVMRGWKKQGDPCASMSYHPTHDRTSYLKIDDDVTVLVGHNIKFDLLYEMCQNNPDLHKFFARGGSVWCTQYGEYLIRGQAKKYQMCAMNDIAEKYGGRKKVDDILPAQGHSPKR